MWDFVKTHRAAVLLVSTTLPLPILSGCGTAVEPVVAAGADGQPAGAVRTEAAQYNAEGELLRPEHHREWIFIGAPVTPNELNNGQAAFPEFHNVYIDPDSYANYQRTGEFANGTTIVKELVSVGGKEMPSGNGYFQGEYVGLEAMVKDTQRFSDEPGGWAFFRFGEAPDYNSTGARMQTVACNACHSGATQDYVFTATYPVLRAARPDSESQ
jgi:hypothetical protein